jgi:zinc transport system substrate-binding protein
MFRFIFLAWAVFFSLMHVQAVRAEERVKVFVSILPQAFFVEQVGGSRVEIDVLVGPGQSPATYEPTPKQMARLTRADIYFSIGVPFEKLLLGKISSTLQHLRIVDTSKGIKLRCIEEDRSIHAGEEAGEEDPHIWLDPKLAKIQAATICRELCVLDPGAAEQYKRNLEILNSKLTEVDSRIAAVLAPYRGRRFFVYHPAFGYFGDSYGLRQVAIETGGKQPSARQLADLIKRLEHAPLKVIFVQPQYSAGSIRALERTLGALVVRIDPLSRDYLKNLEDIAGKLEKSLSGRAASNNEPKHRKDSPCPNP